MGAELAASAVWGTQQVGLFRSESPDFNGVFGVWYGKGPGLDRAGDALKHANLAGASPLGGVLVLAGDDHLAKSSTAPHQSELALADAYIPVLNPAGLQETIDFGLLGIAMSRFSGLWVGMKLTAESMDGSETIDVSSARLELAEPKPDEAFESPDGRHIRTTEKNLQAQELRIPYKLEAAKAFCYANKIDREVTPRPTRSTLGICCTGKSFLDVLDALADLGLDTPESICRAGISVFKVGMPWPLEPRRIGEWVRCCGMQQVLVVEEKRSLIEAQLKEQLYNHTVNSGSSLPGLPSIVGKADEHGSPLLPVTGAINPDQIREAISRYSGVTPNRADSCSPAALALAEANGHRRTPYFCGGCPHNTSTKVPEGSRAIAGIGCSYMSLWMDRSTFTSTHMGCDICDAQLVALPPARF